MDEFGFIHHPANAPLNIFIRSSVFAAIWLFLWELLCVVAFGRWRFVVMVCQWNFDPRRAWHDKVYAIVGLTPLLIFYPRIFGLGGFNLLMALNFINRNLPRRWLWYWQERGRNMNGGMNDPLERTLRNDRLTFILRDTASAAWHIVAAFLLPNSAAIWRLIRHTPLNRTTISLVAAAIVATVFSLAPPLRWHFSVLFRRTIDEAKVRASETLDQAASLVRLSVCVRRAARMEMKDYEYQRIQQQNSEIRLLRLHQKHSTDQIYCDLLSIPLQNAEPFEAISYRWSGRPQYPIVVDGRPYLVLPAVHDILRHVQLPGSERLLWIDSICINQGDDEEKSWQISMMRDIYSRAHRVVGWLGCREGSSGAVTFLYDLRRRAEVEPEKLRD
jgi:hypothetical protein